MTKTYSPSTTAQREAAARCGLRLKREGILRNTVHLLNDTTGALLWSGPYWEAWEFMRNYRSLRVGAH